MEIFLGILSDFITDYPKGFILFLVALVDLAWIFYVVFFQSNFQQKIYKAYFIYAVFIIFWVTSNAYFESPLLALWGEKTAKYMDLLANISSLFSILGFYYISSLLKSNTQKISRLAWFFIVAIASGVLFLNLIPDLTVKTIKILSDGNFEIIFGPAYQIFYLIGVLVVFLGFGNFLLAVKQRSKKSEIEDIRFFYILFGMSLMYGSIIIFHVIFITFFQNYDYVWIPPILSVAEIFIVGYGVLTRRFLSVKLLISRLIKTLVAFAFATFPPYLLYFIYTNSFQSRLPPPYLVPTVLIASLIIYFYLIKFLNSHTFHKIFQITETEYFLKVVGELRFKNTIYTTIQQFQKDVHTTFVHKLHLKFANIILLEENSRRNYRNLIKYFENHKKALVLKEARFISKEGKSNFDFLNELEDLGEVVLPLYQPSRELIGLLVLGNKPFGTIFSKEEIDALEKAQTNFSLKMTGALFGSQLKREVRRKTESLKKQNERIRELLKQQADFIAVSAHELRTPLSIALLQTEILESSFESTHEKQAEISSARLALKKLQNLVQKLFNVQRYDLNKVGLNLQKVKISSFTEALYENFKPIMQEKSIEFKFENELPKNLEIEIDPLQIHQVFQNILTNAAKFTPRKGKVNLRGEEAGDKIQFHVSDSGSGIPDDAKESIFGKFRSLHASKGKGIGLGLYLCKKIIELHKGKIWVYQAESLPGACFCFSLPK